MGTKALDLPPQSGWNWLIDGWKLFRKNPAGVMILAASYLGLLTFITVLIPFVGTVVVALLSPGINAGLLTGCRMIDRGLPVTPSIVVSPFLEENRRLAKPFLRLGVIYAAAVMVISIIGSLFGSIDLASLSREEGATPEALAQFINLLAIMSVLYIPVMMMFWYSPALVLWHETPPGKAIFFSFVTVWRNRGAFLIYSMGWFLWVAAAVAVFAALMAVLPLPAMLVGGLNFLLVLGIFSVSLCTFYPSYLTVFEGKAPAIDSDDSDNSDPTSRL